MEVVQDYVLLRAYSGAATVIYVTGQSTVPQLGISGFFVLDQTDSVSPDNGGTVIVGAGGRRWKRQFDGDICVKWFGAKGDGTANDTASVQAFLNMAGPLRITDGIYIVGPLLVRSNTVLSFSPGAVLKAKTGYATNDSLLSLSGVDDVTIDGNNASIQMLKAEYTTGEWRHGVNITGASNVRITNLRSIDSGGDGFYVGGPTPNRNVSLWDCVGDNNRRQGLSIVNVINCDVWGGEFKNTDGAENGPWCGIDVETNPGAGYFIQNVNIIGVRTYNNRGGGITVVPLSDSNPPSVNVAFCTSEYDGLRCGLSAVGVAATTPMGGAITFSDCSVINPQCAGIGVNNWTNFGPRVVFRNIKILNPGSNAAVATINLYKVGIAIRTEPSAVAGTSYGNVEFDNITVTDNRVVPVTYIPAYLNSGEGVKPLKDIKIKNLSANAWTYASATMVIVAPAVPCIDVQVDYGKEMLSIIPSSTIQGHFIGMTVTSANASTYTLPAAGGLVGSEIGFRVTVAGFLRILPAPGERIASYSSADGEGITARMIGSYVRLRAVAASTWAVVEIDGSWGASNFYGPRYPNSANAAAPTVGTWSVGDIIYNSLPTAGGTIGWVCTTAGTPGTWKAFGNIAA